MSTSAELYVNGKFKCYYGIDGSFSKEDINLLLSDLKKEFGTQDVKFKHIRKIK